MADTKQRLRLLVPDWPAPQNVIACTTLRGHVLADDEYSWFNLAAHVSDIEQRVVRNRLELQTSLALPSEPVWLDQVHGADSIDLAKIALNGQIPPVDAAFTHQVGQVCVVLTADCLPLLVTDKQGQAIAAIHAGWRGLVNGVVANTLERFCVANELQRKDLLVWLGPAISQQYFEVGEEVYAAFLERFDEQSIKPAFKPHAGKEDKYFCDLYVLARLELARLGVTEVFGGDQCTYAQEQDYFSYRRTSHKQASSNCGRMATLIWMSYELPAQQATWLS